MTKEQLIKKLEITENQYYGIDMIDGDLNLDSLNSIPEGFNPIVTGEPLDLVGSEALNVNLSSEFKPIVREKPTYLEEELAELKEKGIIL